MRGLMKLMQSRHSARHSFDPNRLVPGRDLKLILEAARWAPTAHNMQNFEILVVDDKKQLKAIENIQAAVPEAFLRENYSQLSFSEKDLQVRKSGVLASLFPPAWTDPKNWRPDSDYNFQHSFLGRAMQESPLLIIVLHDTRKRAPASEGDVLGYVSLGCVMENMWLMSESLGIQFQVLSVFSDDPAEARVKELLHIPQYMKIAFACRLGYPAAPAVPYLRVRRSIEDFCHANQFGSKNLSCLDIDDSRPAAPVSLR